MKIYLVGGAIRDALLGLPVKERDWVVVGATPEELLAEGFQPVGKDFPVFLHPETHEEYALARTERKTAKGYKGFTFHAEPNVTLEEDLKRRDLTINAIAQSDTDELIDPYDGQLDLQKKILRHVSPAFAEDPVRILRVARFASKLPEFNIDPETNRLMIDMVNKGEVDALVAERVWQELSRALEEKAPTRFFEVLKDCDALAILFPMIGLHNNGTKAMEHTATGVIRFSVLMHDIETQALKDCCKRYRIPKEYSELALLTNQWHGAYQKILGADAKTLLDFIKKTDALRRPNRFARFLKACHACVNDDSNENRDTLLQNTIDAVKSVDIAPLQSKDLKGQNFANALEDLQIAAINHVLDH